MDTGSKNICKQKVLLSAPQQIKWFVEKTNRINVMTLWKIFAVDTQFKQLRKRSLKKFRLQRDSNPWPLRYRCSALPAELWSHNCWEQVNFSGSIMPLRVIQHLVTGFEPRLWVMTLWKIFAVDTQFKQLRKRSLKKIQASLSQLLKLRINREDLS